MARRQPLQALPKAFETRQRTVRGRAVKLAIGGQTARQTHRFLEPIDHMQLAAIVADHDHMETVRPQIDGRNRLRRTFRAAFFALTVHMSILRGPAGAPIRESMNTGKHRHKEMAQAIMSQWRRQVHLSGPWPLALMLVTAVVLGGCASQPNYPAQSPYSGVSTSRHADHGAMVDALYDYYHQWRGVPYRYGGVDRNGIDCSAFV